MTTTEMARSNPKVKRPTTTLTRSQGTFNTAALEARELHKIETLEMKHNGVLRKHQTCALYLGTIKLAHARKHKQLEQTHAVHYNKLIVQTKLSQPLIQKIVHIA